MKKIDNLQAWRAFLAVSKTGSMSIASQVPDMDSPTISHYITDLESELGFKLIDRSTRPFRLTPRGRIVADNVDPLERGFQNLAELFKDEAKSVITVAAPLDLNQFYLHDQLFSYGLEHPSVRFYLRASCPIEDVISGRVDIAMIDRPVSNPDLVSRFCVQDLSVPLATTEYVERCGNPKTPEDLKSHTGLLLRQGMHQMTSYLYDREGRMSPPLRWKRFFMADTQITLNHMMLEGKGIVIDCVPQHLARELEEGRLVRVLPGWRRKPQELCIVTRRDRESLSDELHDFALWWTKTEKAAATERTRNAERLLKSVLEA